MGQRQIWPDKRETTNINGRCETLKLSALTTVAVSVPPFGTIVIDHAPIDAASEYPQRTAADRPVTVR
jgi:hypothetical protein